MIIRNVIVIIVIYVSKGNIDFFIFLFRELIELFKSISFIIIFLK